MAKPPGMGQKQWAAVPFWPLRALPWVGTSQPGDPAQERDLGGQRDSAAHRFCFWDGRQQHLPGGIENWKLFPGHVLAPFSSCALGPAASGSFLG